jgi:predicted metallopeptidase
MIQIYAVIVPLFWDLWTSKSCEGDKLRLNELQKTLIGQWMEEAAPDIPGFFGAAPSNLNLGRNSQYKLFEWAAFLHWYSLPFLVRLQAPTEIISHWGLFVKAISLVLDPAGISESQLEVVEEMLNKFIVDFEKIYIRDRLDLADRGKLYLFQLLHIPEMIRLNGTYRLGAQFSMERTIGFYKRLIRSQKYPFSNLANRIIFQELLAILSLHFPEFDTFLGNSGVNNFVPKSELTSPVPLSPLVLKKSRVLSTTDFEEERLLIELILETWKQQPSNKELQELSTAIASWARFGKVKTTLGFSVRSVASEQSYTGNIRHACRVQVNTYMFVTFC